jgi:hypothetical protein
MLTISSVDGCKQPLSQLFVAGADIKESVATLVRVMKNRREIFVKHSLIKTGFSTFVANKKAIQETNLRLPTVEVE